jgi:hypothetical protein
LDTDAIAEARTDLRNCTLIDDGFPALRYAGCRGVLFGHFTPLWQGMPAALWHADHHWLGRARPFALWVA